MKHIDIDPRHNTGAALHPLKELPLWADEAAAADANEDAKELVRKINAWRAEIRAAELARWEAGRFFIYEAVTLLADQRGLNESLQDDLCKAMLRCAALPDDHRHKLIVRELSTCIPMQHGVRISHASIVYRSDVNAWLDATGAGYRWEGDMPDPAVRTVPAATFMQAPPAGQTFWKTALYSNIAKIDLKHPPRATALQAIAYLKALDEPRLTFKAGDTFDKLQWRNNAGDPKSVSAKSIGNAIPGARRWAAGSSTPG